MKHRNAELEALVDELKLLSVAEGTSNWGFYKLLAVLTEIDARLKRLEAHVSPGEAE